MRTLRAFDGRAFLREAAPIWEKKNAVPSDARLRCAPSERLAPFAAALGRRMIRRAAGGARSEGPKLAASRASEKRGRSKKKKNASCSRTL